MTNESPYHSLADALCDPLFPEVDVALRQGRHIHRAETDRYEFLSDANDHLERWYKKYDCDLVRSADGYFYLLPQQDKVRRRQLSLAEMLIGKVLALLYLDPATLQRSGIVERTLVFQSLATLVGQENLLLRLCPRRKRRDERTEQEQVRKELKQALISLCELGFCERLDEEMLRLHPPVLRFADSVRSADAPDEALRELIRAGKAVRVEPESPDESTEVDEEPDAAQAQEDVE